MKTALWIVLLGLLALAARCHNWRETFISGHLYFLDGDCYARMTRARIIAEHPGRIIHQHDFENFPEGVRSHTTAPLDYAIVLLNGFLRISEPLWGRWAPALRGQTLDLAGGLISPLIGALTCAYLGWWSSRGLPGFAPHRFAVAAPALLFAFSPVLVHADLLGRPDHQSAVVLFLAVALTAELALLAPGVPPRTARAWAVTAGAGWGMALWISLFEPLLLLAFMAVLVPILGWASIRRRERLWEAGVLLGLVLLMLAVEGAPIPHLAPEVREFFPRWGSTVGELKTLPLGGTLLYRWLGWGCLAAPVLLFLGGRRGDRRAWLLLALLLALLAATCWHLRWGYFLALAFALALPWLLAWCHRRWLAWLCLSISLFPLASEWDRLLFPNPDDLAVLRRERALLRDLSRHLPTDGVYPFLAPWWLSPALAYWSGQPGVTGSSHEGLSGIVASARFYLAERAEPAAAILQKRRVAYVIIDDPQRLRETSAPLLGVVAPVETLCDTLYRTPHSGPAFLALTYANHYYKLFSVDPAQLAP